LVYERDPETIRRAIATMPAVGANLDQLVLPIGFWKGVLGRIQNDPAAAKEGFTAARAQIENLLRDQPDYAPGLCSLGLIDAGLGNKEQAISEGRRAKELLPVAKDNANGIHMIEFLGVIYAWLGEKDLALQEVTSAASQPGTHTYGQLRLSPLWDPLRDDPRFDNIVATLAPR
jgi:hypothetical protein